MNSLCNHCCTKIENLTVKYGETVVLEGINVHLNCGELVAVAGPNGAGKTTLLKAVLGEHPYDGKISFKIEGDPHQRATMGYVPQKLNFDLDSPISVADFVAISISQRPTWLGLSRKLIKQIKIGLSKFSAEHLLYKKIGELSGGEMQKVLLSVAMTPPPNILLLDEPDAGVDAEGISLFTKTLVIYANSLTSQSSW